MWLWIIGGIYGAVALAVFIGGLWDWRTTHHGIEPGMTFSIAILWPLFLVMAVMDGF